MLDRGKLKVEHFSCFGRMYTNTKDIENLLISRGLQCIVGQDFLSMMQAMTKKKTKANKELFVAFFWVIWQGRKIGLFEGKREKSLSLVAKARLVIESF